MRKIIPWIIVLAVGAGLLILANLFRDKGLGNISQQQIPTPSEVVTPSASSSSSLNPNSLPKQIAATCQITGEIIFLDKNIYENKGAKIAYQNVDDVIRQIYWKSKPNDNTLIVGPNLFEDLPLPDGERNVGVAIKKESEAKNYTLTASITYGIKRADGEIKEGTADCVGEILVRLP